MANEPVAWHYPDGKPDQCTTNKEYAEKEPAWTPMYHKHEWAGLTDEDRYAARAGAWYMDSFDIDVYTKIIEAKLKEKNNG